MDLAGGLSLGVCRGSRPPWLPSSLPNLALWLTAAPAYCFTDAAATVPCGDGDAVYTWLDRSGLGNHLVQATLASRPTLVALGGGLWKVVFDGVDDKLTLSSPAGFAAGNAARATFVKYQSASLPLLSYPFASGAGSDNLDWAVEVANNSDGGVRIVCFNNDWTSSLIADTNLDVLSFWHDGATRSLRRNGISGGTNATTLATQNNAVWIGAGLIGQSGFFPGDVYEVVYAAANLTAGQIAQVETYLGV